jgi:type I restriction enzyme R subunit
MLVNGLPVIHIELKAEFAKDGYFQAFDQIKRYAGAGFFDGIYATVQIFVISNKVATRYFARPSKNDDFSGAKSFSLTGGNRIIRLLRIYMILPARF